MPQGYDFHVEFARFQLSLSLRISVFQANREFAVLRESSGRCSVHCVAVTKSDGIYADGSYRERRRLPGEKPASGRCCSGRTGAGGRRLGKGAGGGGGRTAAPPSGAKRQQAPEGRVGWAAESRCVRGRGRGREAS